MKISCRHLDSTSPRRRIELFPQRYIGAHTISSMMASMQKAKPPKNAMLDSSARSVLDSIRRIVRALRVSSRAAEKTVGLSGAQLFVLQRISDGQPVSINDLAARTLTHQSSVSVVVQRLERLGLVKRSRSSDDARRHMVSLTKSGRNRLRKPADLAQTRLIKALAALPAAKRVRLASALQVLVNSAGFSNEPAELFFEKSAPRNSSSRKSKS